jgi:hypothetical protein
LANNGDNHNDAYDYCDDDNDNYGNDNDDERDDFDNSQLMLFKIYFAMLMLWQNLPWQKLLILRFILKNITMTPTVFVTIIFSLLSNSLSLPRIIYHGKVTKLVCMLAMARL